MVLPCKVSFPSHAPPSPPDPCRLLSCGTAESYAIRVYGAVFCVGVVLSELNVTSAIRNTVLVQNWISRGIFYAL